MSERVVVGVRPGAERTRRRVLFDALEEAVGARFVAWEGEDPAGLDAVLAFGTGARRETLPPGLPSMACAGEERPGAEAVTLVIADDPGLERPLRRATLSERSPLAPLAVPEGCRILARAGAVPVWTTGPGGHREVALAPAELAPGEALRERLAPGRCLALLALLDLIRAAAADDAWSRPPLRAAIILDDPNLRRPRYGHLDYARVAAHAREHRYHLAVAMVPLDGWSTHPATARLVRERPELSVVAHGNDHLAGELALPRDERAALALALSAQRRIAAFERRTGVHVARVMVPPHERAGAAMPPALLDAGFEALCMTRPYPWVATPERHWLERPPGAGPLAGWRPADFVGPGLPVLLRSAFTHPREDLVLRALLGQPLVLYGHHDDLAGGLETLERAAADVNALGDVHWGPLDDVARGGAETRRDGRVLHVRPWSRRVGVEVPNGVDRIVVEPPPEAQAVGVRALTPGPPGVGSFTLRVARPGRLALEVIPARRPASARVARPRPWPVLRRLAGEGRDRLGPSLRRRAPGAAAV